ncbi:MAG: hypothetical protein JWN15_2400 [Firmicutes bacterium]|nr:hypothetical protein [Bacillota bacterium]
MKEAAAVIHEAGAKYVLEAERLTTTYTRMWGRPCTVHSGSSGSKASRRCEHEACITAPAHSKTGTILYRWVPVFCA